MNEIYLQSSRAKANRYGRSPRFSSEVPVPFHGSLSETLLRFMPAITSLTRLRVERIGANVNPIGDKGLKTTLSVNTSKNASAWDGLLNLSPEDLPLTTRGSLLAMRPSINGSIRRPPILFCPWSEPIVNENTEVTPESIKNLIFLRESRSKSVPKPFSSAFTSATGKQIPSAAVKATRPSKLPWNAKLDTQRWLNLKPRVHEL